MYRSDNSQDQKPGAFIPLIGFIVMILVGGFSYLVAAPVKEFVTTQEFYFGSFGWQIFPVAFPATWPESMQTLVVGGVVFMFLFIIFMIIMLLLLPTPNSEYQDIIKEQQAAKKQSKKKRR